MARKWTVGATGFALLATTFVVVACSSKSDDDDSGNDNAAKGGSGNSGTAGKAPTGGSTTMGGSSGTGTGGTGGSSGGMGGTATTSGGMAGTTAGGMGGAAAGAAGAVPFDCAMPAAATCNLIVNWGTFAPESQFQGTYSYQETTVVLDKMTDPTKLHITGTVSKYDGFGIYTGKCSSLAGYTGVTFTLSGTTSSIDKPNVLKFVAQMNADEPIDTTNKKGACVGSAGVECVSPSKVIAPADAPQSILFTDLTGGKPTAALDPTQVLGFQWQIDPDASATPFAIDLVLSNFQLTGGGAPADCSMGMGGMGGMGGASGGQGGATGGQGGATGGQGGATGGQGGATAGGRGGMSGGAGRAGGAGRGGAGAGGRSP